MSEKPGRLVIHYDEGECYASDRPDTEAVAVLARLRAIEAAAREVIKPINHREHAQPAIPSSECDECYAVRGPRFAALREALHESV